MWQISSNNEIISWTQRELTEVEGKGILSSKHEVNDWFVAAAKGATEVYFSVQKQAGNSQEGWQTQTRVGVRDAKDGTDARMKELNKMIETSEGHAAKKRKLAWLIGIVKEKPPATRSTSLLWKMLIKEEFSWLWRKQGVLDGEFSEVKGMADVAESMDKLESELERTLREMDAARKWVAQELRQREIAALAFSGVEVDIADVGEPEPWQLNRPIDTDENKVKTAVSSFKLDAVSQVGYKGLGYSAYSTDEFQAKVKQGVGASTRRSRRARRG